MPLKVTQDPFILHFIPDICCWGYPGPEVMTQVSPACPQSLAFPLNE